MSRPFFAPEVLQTSGMDCGPATLKGLLAGLGIEANYDRLRDACRTGPDGTSIDTIEDLAVSLGLEAYQEIVPLGDAIETMRKLAPCIVVMRGSGGAPHFVVLWRVFLGFVEIMDPARGRVWLTRSGLSRSLYRHTQRFEGDDFAEWFSGTEWRAVLERRLARIRAPQGLLSVAKSMAEIGAVDSGARLVERLIEQKAVARSSGGDALHAFLRVAAADREALSLPAPLAAVLPSPEGPCVVRGAVVLVARTADPSRPPVPVREDLRGILGVSGPPLFATFAATMHPLEKRLGALVALLAAILGALALVEMFFLRAAFNAEALLALPHQRFTGTLSYGVLVALVMAFELLMEGGVLRLGQALELRARLALLRKLPKLPDSYFRTRPLSDVTHRSQGLFTLRPLPSQVIRVAKRAVDLLVTVTALAILFPPGISYVALGLVLGLAGPYIGFRLRQSVEGRVQSHASALGQLYLDVLLGLMPLRTHGGQQAIRAKQDEYLVGWRRESERSVQVLSTIEALQSVGLLATVVLLLLAYVRAEGSHGGLLLMVFWALKLPLEARGLAQGAQSLPSMMSSMRRLLEPLTARESVQPKDNRGDHTVVFTHRPGMALSVRNARVQLGVEELLSGLTLEVPAGQHVAIVGSSGSGKSTFFGMLLGLIERVEGDVRVDDCPIEKYDVARFRRETVWVDPSVQLWNRSFIENCQFGNPRSARHPLDSVLDEAKLKDLLERMPRGFATELGESGARVSGGEGQRVRLSRALLRRGARLFLLDEAFRGLDRPTRRSFSRRLRERAAKATVIEITHDVADTQDFDRVLVIENGRLIEDASPAELLATPSSRYAELVRADRDILENVWDAAHWKRVYVAGGAAVVTTVDETAVEAENV